MSDRTAIPSLFHSEYGGGLFDRCAVCEASLLEPDAVYTISKTCNQGEAIVEMAVCDGCSDNLRDELSDDSRAAVTEFVESRLMDTAFETADDDPANSPLFALLAEPNDAPIDPLEVVSACSLCRKKRDDCRTFSITAYCVGEEMVVRQSGPLALGIPAMLCDDCNAEASRRLSKETRETWDRFFEEHINTPPSISLDGPTPMLGI